MHDQHVCFIDIWIVLAADFIIIKPSLINLFKKVWCVRWLLAVMEVSRPEFMCLVSSQSRLSKVSVSVSVSRFKGLGIGLGF